MTTHCFVLASLLFAAAGIGRARDGGSDAIFELRDSSRIVGRIVHYDQGVFRVKSASVGFVNISVGNISAVIFDPARVTAAGGLAAAPEPAGSPPAPEAAPGRQEAMGGVFAFDNVLRALTGDPRVMAQIEELRNDKDVQAILEDETVLKAIEEGNFFQLLRNEKIRELMSNPKVKSISSGVAVDEKKEE